MVAAEGAPASTWLYSLLSNATWGLARLLHWADGSAVAARRSAYLLGAYAPVEREVEAARLEVVEGELPPELAGFYARVGPNPHPDRPPMGGYHWFDGDGMIHGVRLKAGHASYCNRWVRTERLAQEERAGWALCNKIGDYQGFRALLHMARARLAQALGLLSSANGLGTANTALVWHAGRLLALHEGDLPYQLRIACEGLVDTVGRVTLGGKAHDAPQAFTAHPKRDLATGDLFFFRYSVHKAPFCGYGRCNAVGEVVSSFSVDIPDPVMMHDFAVTDKHAIIIDVPLLFKPEHMIKSGTLPFVFDKTRRGGTRFGVLPRDAASADAIQWFETEPFMAFHVAAAWEEEDSIHVVLCAFADFSLDTFVVTGEDSLPYLTEVRLELATGGTTVRRLTSLPGDFPVVPPAPLGRRPRYVFLAAMQQPTTPDGVPCFNGVAKVDLQSSSPDSTVAGRIVHPPGCSGGEASFVARPGGSGEDDGYLVTFITDAEATQSWLVIYDARTMSSQPVVRLRLPQRVPHGFHGMWVTEEELQAQEHAPL